MAAHDVDRYARSVNKVATELGCDWHTVNEAVITYRWRLRVPGVVSHSVNSVADRSDPCRLWHTNMPAVIVLNRRELGLCLSA